MQKLELGQTRARRRGVTLFEVLIVVAIIALVSAGVSVVASRYWIRARETTAATNARNIRHAVPLWWAEHDPNACPEFGQLVSDGVLDQDSPTKDPWGTPWRIECSDHTVTVSSNGRDKVAGTNDDIRIPPPT